MWPAVQVACAVVVQVPVAASEIKFMIRLQDVRFSKHTTPVHYHSMCRIRDRKSALDLLQRTKLMSGFGSQSNHRVS